jgi:hypothetical protein
VIVKKPVVTTAVVFALLPFVLTGCPKKSGDASDASADGAGTVTAAADDTASATPSATAVAPTHAAVSCKAGETAFKVKGAHGVETQCHHTCRIDTDCPRAQFCSGKSTDSQSFCQTGKEAQATKCKPGEKLVMVAAVMSECITVCKTDADCKGSKCGTGTDYWDTDDASIHYKGCAFGAAPMVPPTVSAAAGGLVVPPGQPFSFPNPKHLPCPTGYFMSGDTCQQSSRPGQ